VQTTLLSAGIAIILALLAALVGPYFVNWENWRGSFESEVGQLTGLDVQVKGPIEVRLLPTPTVKLQDIELGSPGDGVKTGPPKTKARELSIEFALGDLLRGTWRATDMILRGPELTVGLDLVGRLAWSAPTIGVDPDSVAIEHLAIEDGRLIFADAASGTRLQLEQLKFSGQVRSLLGPVKGEGSFVRDGQSYPFELSASRPTDDGGVKVRLGVRPLFGPPSFDIDGSIFVERGKPRFDGTLLAQLVRPVGVVVEGPNDPWRVSSRLHADGSGAVLQEIEFQGGADERAIHLKGNANLSLSAHPELAVTLSGPQLDLDQVMAVPEGGDRRPLAVVKRLAEALAAAPAVPVPVRFAFTIEAVTLGGATLQKVGGDVASNRDGWNIIDFSVRAPGVSDVGFSGQLSALRGVPSFSGQTEIDSADLQALMGWLTAHGDAPVAPGHLHAKGEISLASGAFGLDRLDLDINHTKAKGALHLAWAAGDRPSAIDADLSAEAVDLDRVLSLAQSGLGRELMGLEQGTPALGRAALGGTEAKNVAIKMRYDPAGLSIDRLTVGDMGGASFSLSGRVDTRAAAPRGLLSLDLDAGSLDAVAAVAAKASASLAAEIRHAATRAVPLHLHSSLALDRDGTEAATATAAKVRLQGNAGVFRLDLQGDAAGSFQSLGDLARLADSKVHLKGGIEANDGSALAELFWLDRLVGVSQRSGWLKFEANGPPDGEMAVNSELRAGGLEVTAGGTLRPLAEQGAKARISFNASAQDVALLRLAYVGRAVQQPRSTLKGELTLADGTVKLADLDGTLGGNAVKGNLDIAADTPPRLSGDLDLAYFDLPSVIGAAIGWPHVSAGSGANNNAWPADPFEAGLLGGDLDGRITIKAGQAALSAKLGARDLHAVLDFNSSSLALAQIDGALAGGRLRGDVGFTRGPEGVATHFHLDLADVDAAALFGGGAAPLSGKLTAALDLSGNGRSPVALVGSLAGQGKLTLRDGAIARMNPAAFEKVAGDVDRGLPIDAQRVGVSFDVALAQAALPVPLVEGSIAINMGQLRPVDLVVRAGSAELAPSGSIDLTQSAIDARLALSGPAGDGADGSRANVTVSLKGPIDAPKRTLDVVALTHWLALRAADQKAKRVDALEQAAREHPDDDPTTGTPGDTDAATSPSSLPRPAVQSPRQRPTAADQPARPRPAVDQAPLPPPLDIRPPAAHGPRG
jgi:uncharacterized protein involved in outer membrane biogenesis